MGFKLQKMVKYFSSVTNVGSSTEVDQGATPIHSSCGGGHLLVEDADFELVVLEHLEKIIFRHFKTLERLFFLHNLLHEVIQDFEVRI